MGPTLLLLLLSLGLFAVAQVALHWRRSYRWRHFPGAHWATSLPVVGHAYQFLFMEGRDGDKTKMAVRKT